MNFSSLKKRPKIPSGNGETCRNNSTRTWALLLLVPKSAITTISCTFHPQKFFLPVCYCNGVRWPSYHRHHYVKGSLPPICTSMWITSNIYLQNYAKIHELGHLICCEKYYTIFISTKTLSQGKPDHPPRGCIFLLFPSQSI